LEDNTSMAERSQNLESLFQAIRNADTDLIGKRLACIHDTDEEIEEAAFDLFVELCGEDTRWDAFRALGQVGSAALPLLTRALRHKRNDIRYVAVQTMGEMGTPGVPGLIIALENKRSRVRLHAVEHLWNMEPPASDALPALIATLTQEIAALANLTGAYSYMTNGMVYTLNDSFNMIAFILSHLPVHGPAAKDAVPILIDVIQKPIGNFHAAAIRTLGAIGWAAKDAVPALFHIASQTDTTNDSLRTDAIEALNKICSDESEAEVTLWTPEGIEVLGDDAVLALAPLDTFRRIGEICSRRGTDTFTFEEMPKALGLPKSTIQAQMKRVSDLFRNYFRKFEDRIDIPVDTAKVPKRGKLFDRGQGKPVTTICRPLGWRAWTLACEFLERYERAEKAMRRAAHKMVDSDINIHQVDES
jgi:HEAT repeat protein